MSMTRKQLNDWALVVDSSARDFALADTLQQSLDWYAMTPGYAATFQCIHQCLDPETTTHYSWNEWYFHIANNTTYLLDAGSFRRAA